MVATVIAVLALALTQPATAKSAMQADVDRLVARAEKLTTLWPWQPAIPEVDRVARHGTRVAPLLVRLLDDDPDSGNPQVREWRIQQQAGLALCRIYRVREECGRVYCNRATAEVNRGIKKFWLSKISEAQLSSPGRPNTRAADPSSRFLHQIIRW